MSDSRKFVLAGDFPLLKKINASKKDEMINGFGGIKKDFPLKHTPILFFHGNGGDKNRFLSMAQLFLDQGYTMQELWAFSFMGEPSIKNTTGDPHTKELADFDQIILAVMNYTGAKKINIIAHSFSVTLTLYWMKQKNVYHLVDRLIMIAGAPNGFPNMEKGSEWNKEWMDENIHYQGESAPFGIKSQIKPENDKRITYVVVYCAKDDNLINSFGENSQTSLMTGVDATYNLEGKIKISEHPTEAEISGGLHTSIVMNPGEVFKVIQSYFL